MEDASPDYRLLRWASYAALFCLGLSASAIGPVLPFLADDVDVSLDTAGLLLTAFFVGSIASSSLVAVMLHARDQRALIAAGLACQLTGTLMLGLAPSWEMVLVSGVVIGVGDGLVVASSHVLIAAISEDVASGINVMNLFFAIGAIAGPVWTGAVLAGTGDRWIVYAGISACLGATLALTVLADVAAHAAVSAEGEFRIPTSGTAWIMGAVLFLYVGAEFGLGAWVSSFAQQTLDAGVFVAALITAGYWAALALGRVASAWYFAGQRDPATLLLIGCAGAGLAALMLTLSSGNIAVASAAAFGAGFFFGPIWPAVTSIVASDEDSGATAATVTIGNAGGVAIPWLQGKVLVGAGATQGVAVTAALCGVMLVVSGVFRAGRRRLAEADVVRI